MYSCTEVLCDLRHLFSWSMPPDPPLQTMRCSELTKCDLRRPKYFAWRIMPLDLPIHLTVYSQQGTFSNFSRYTAIHPQANVIKISGFSDNFGIFNHACGGVGHLECNCAYIPPLPNLTPADLTCTSPSEMTTRHHANDALSMIYKYDTPLVKTVKHSRVTFFNNYTIKQCRVRLC